VSSPAATGVTGVLASDDTPPLDELKEEEVGEFGDRVPVAGAAGTAVSVAREGRSRVVPDAVPLVDEHAENARLAVVASAATAKMVLSMTSPESPCPSKTDSTTHSREGGIAAENTCVSQREVD